MKTEMFFIQSLHTSTKRDYLARMCDEKIVCMKEAKKYDINYWDGDRRFGYGGYKYLPGRWADMAKKLIETYGLSNSSSILDIGCGKGFLLYELEILLPDISITGIDISEYGIRHKHENLKADLKIFDAREKLPFKDKTFDLVLSINTFHNFKLNELETSLSEMQRVGNEGYLVLESYRNEDEQFNLECWALTAETIICKEDWLWLYNKTGYEGDYEFIYFE